MESTAGEGGGRRRDCLSPASSEPGSPPDQSQAAGANRGASARHAVEGNVILGALRRELEVVEQRLAARMGRVERQCLRLREASERFPRLDERMADVEATLSVQSRRAIELGGGLQGMKDELQVLVGRVAGVDERLWEAQRGVRQVWQACTSELETTIQTLVTEERSRPGTPSAASAEAETATHALEARVDRLAGSQECHRRRLEDVGRSWTKMCAELRAVHERQECHGRRLDVVEAQLEGFEEAAQTTAPIPAAVVPTADADAAATEAAAAAGGPAATSDEAVAIDGTKSAAGAAVKACVYPESNDSDGKEPKSREDGAMSEVQLQVNNHCEQLQTIQELMAAWAAKFQNIQKDVSGLSSQFVGQGWMLEQFRDRLNSVLQKFPPSPPRCAAKAAEVQPPPWPQQCSGNVEDKDLESEVSDTRSSSVNPASGDSLQPKKRAHFAPEGFEVAVEKCADPSVEVGNDGDPEMSRPAAVELMQDATFSPKRGIHPQPPQAAPLARPVVVSAGGGLSCWQWFAARGRAARSGRWRRSVPLSRR